jgi:hypothetical protein
MARQAHRKASSDRVSGSEDDDRNLPDCLGGGRRWEAEGNNDVDPIRQLGRELGQELGATLSRASQAARRRR